MLQVLKNYVLFEEVSYPKELNFPPKLFTHNVRIMYQRHLLLQKFEFSSKPVCRNKIINKYRVTEIFFGQIKLDKFFPEI